ncbi:MAG: adenosylcobinamide-GDP ribazoletransferase, partial [Gammaproteobacteria bacterium]|nr:adenosylcobinamide-GDP ribazoletransferase [Gammaproteobacteria bacterium]
GFSDRTKTLEIMKDPCSGPIAVVTLILVIAIKFTAIEQLVVTQSWTILMLTPVISRTSLILLFLTTPYVRQNGLGSHLANHLPRQTSLLVLAMVVLGSLFLTGTAAFWLLIVTAGIFYMLRHLLLRRLGGTTGDTAGALVEISEAVLLVTAVLIGA